MSLTWNPIVIHIKYKSRSFSTFILFFYFTICWWTFRYGGWSLIIAPTLMSRALSATTAWVTRPSRLLGQVSLSDAGRASPCLSWFGVLSQFSVFVSKLPVLGIKFCVSLFTKSTLFSSFMRLKFKAMHNYVLWTEIWFWQFTHGTTWCYKVHFSDLFTPTPTSSYILGRMCNYFPPSPATPSLMQLFS